MILLVENDLLLAESVFFALEIHGYEVSVAYNGREGLTQAGWQKPELIITDWMMPEMNGMELCRRLKANDELASVPVIMMSGMVPDSDGRVPYDAFVQKPFLTARLLEAVDALSGRARRRVESRYSDDRDWL